MVTIALLSLSQWASPYTDDEGNGTDVREISYDGRKGFLNTVGIRAGRSVTYEFDVAVSAEATEPLGIDMTPLAQEAAGWQ